MINQIKSKYPHCDILGCHQITQTSFFVKDDAPNKCIITYDSTKATCYIDNTNNIDIHFVCVDACLINETNIQKCDLILITDSIFWFIELKEVLYNGNLKADRTRKIRNAKKAVKQLASTINDFKAKGIDLSNHIVAGLISFPPYLNEPNPISIPSTASQSRINQFSLLCGYVDLFEGNYIGF